MKNNLSKQQIAAQKWQKERKTERSDLSYHEKTGRLLDLAVFFGRPVDLKKDERWLHEDPPGFESRRGVYLNSNHTK